YAGHETTTRVHLIPRLGHIKLSKLEPADIDKAYAAMLAEGTSPSMIQHAHLRLSKALNDALRRKLIYRNPCQIVTPPRVTRKELRPPDADAIHRILEAAKGKEYYELFFIAFHTGLRRNETLALQWRDVDLDMGTISVNRNIYHAKGSQTHYHEPKTAKGRRLVSLTPSSILVLRALRERQQADAATFSYQVTDDSPVFRYRDGLRMLPRAVSGAFKKLVRKLGMDGFNFHTTRHAHATLMLRQGVHPSIVQSRLGHSRVSTTLDIYSHILPGLQEAAALRFEEGLMAAKKPEQAKEPVTG
ncbi:MAG: site-specific integrase, partial [Chloroflexi bacterium]|nr:site-specific integrase [Chloroflexota bacterium]